MKQKELFNKEFKKELYLLLSKSYLKSLQDLSPVGKTGRLSADWYLVEQADMEYVLVNDTEYANYVDAGTGIYATKGYEKDYAAVPGRKPITPTKKKALAWRVGGGGKGGSFVVVKSTKGIQARKYVQAAMLSEKAKNTFEKGFDKLIEKNLLKSFIN
jgi:hypothetical protein